MIVAFFDFDGTITKKDSFLDFIAFHSGKFTLYCSAILFLRSIIGYKLGFVSGHVVKEKLLTHFFRGTTATDFQEKANAYVKSRLPHIIKVAALERIQWHQQQGHRIIVVSASIEQWIKPWCINLNIECIATKLETKEGILTGKLVGNNCIGKEKVRRIENHLDLKKVTYSYGYGNSKGDLEMLQFVDKAYYKNFQ